MRDTVKKLGGTGEELEEKAEQRRKISEKVVPMCANKYLWNRTFYNFKLISMFAIFLALSDSLQCTAFAVTNTN